MKRKVALISVLLSINVAFVACAGPTTSLVGSDATERYISIEESDIEMWAGEEKVLTFSSSFDKSELVWECTNSSASVYQGKVKAIKAGEVTVICSDRTGEIYDTVKVKIRQDAYDFSVSDNQTEIGLGDTVKLKVTLYPESAEEARFNYSSSDETVLTVDENGMVTGIKEGSAVVTVTDEKSRSKYITIRVVDGMKYDILPAKIREFLSANRADSYAEILNYTATEYKSKIYYDTQDLKLVWEGDGSSVYNVKISETEDFETYKEINTSKCEIKKGTFIPGKTYYIRVTGNSGVIFEQKIRIKNQPVRMLNVDGVANVRDLGGWATASGKTVKYGMLIRGAELDGNNGSNATASGIKTLTEELGIKTEIDLRMSKEKQGLSDNALGFNKYLWKAIYEYCAIIPESNTNGLNGDAGYQTASAGYLKDIFNCLADENNYPVYFHCVWGADRTGTLAFLINGLLGVSYEDLVKDFELTTFSHSGKRSSVVDANDLAKSTEPSVYTAEQLKNMGSSNLFRTYWQLMTYYGTDGGTLSDAIENYLVTVCKVTKTNIEAIKSILLEDNN